MTDVSGAPRRPPADHRAVLRVRAAIRRRRRTWSRRTHQQAVQLTGLVLDGHGTQCGTPCWRSGRPTPTAHRAARGSPAPRRPHVHGLGPRRDRRHRPLPVHHGRSGGPSVRTAGVHRHDRVCRGLLTDSSRRVYLPGAGRSGTTRCSAPCPSGVAGRCSRSTRCDELHFDVRLQGPDETVFLRLAGRTGDHLAVTGQASSCPITVTRPRMASA